LELLKSLIQTQDKDHLKVGNDDA